jgi:uncharacterized protein (UPF0276 family)
MYKKPGSNFGVGINYHHHFGEDILRNISQIDFIEVFTEKFFVKENDETLSKILKNIPLVLHGLDLSIGSSGPVKMEYLEKLRSLFNEINFEWFSDHVSLTHENNFEVGHLMPVQFSEENVFEISTKAKKVASLTSTPFLLENITYYYPIPGQSMSEEDFIAEILESADCGMLLDVNNLYINSQNHGYDPITFLNKIPVERVVEIHIAGGSFKHGMLVDTHANPVSNKVWNLFDEVCQRVPFNGVIIERDSNLDKLEDLIGEVNIAKKIMKKNGIYKNIK